MAGAAPADEPRSRMAFAQKGASIRNGAPGFRKKNSRRIIFVERPGGGCASDGGILIPPSMKTITRITLCCIALATAVSARAQSTAYDGVPSGTLGTRYGEFNYGFTDIRHYSPHFHDLNIGGNLPLTPNLDLGGNFAHGWFGDRAPGIGHALGVSLTAYPRREGVRPFATVGLGYQWWNVGADDTWGWSAIAGLQVPFGRLTLTPRLGYADDFRRSSLGTRQFSAGTEANYWLTHNAGVFLSVGFTDVHRSRFDAWNWRGGMRLAF